MSWQAVVLVLGILALLVVGFPLAMSMVYRTQAEKLHAEARKAGR